MGNTHPFTEADWARTFDLAEEAGLDGLVLNLGKERWQLERLATAYNMASRRLRRPVLNAKPIQLMMSLDMSDIPSESWAHGKILVDTLVRHIQSPAQMRHGEDNRPLLTTFGGEDAKFGGRGWHGVLARFAEKSHNGKRPFFWPGFHQDSKAIIENEDVDGTFAWSNAWPQNNHRLTLTQDLPFLMDKKPHMMGVSPLFFTHYGKTGRYNFDKNFIYRSDDLLYPSRWREILELAPDHSPEMVQVISWNDYGESHAISPSMGAEPGSRSWTRYMNHVAFREMTSYFGSRWRDGAPEVSDEIVIWAWYRIHGKNAKASLDPVPRPENADWAQDLINAVVLVPEALEDVLFEVVNGRGKGSTHSFKLRKGMNMLTMGFQPGRVDMYLHSKLGLHIRAKGKGILKDDDISKYNFNFWSGAWHAGIPGVGIGRRAPTDENRWWDDETGAWRWNVSAVDDDDVDLPSGASEPVDDVEEDIDEAL